ncbi:hypothetical protein FQN53_000347 [Emmonsiellopsis sp. PD_33]|nr:hypothetical protein FQN53_000347 [Emmonsiellopsis sp. PD_33]KAK2803434.1 hypothetical protein FQN51_003541 [Onygenales sp. PD_10]
MPTSVQNVIGPDICGYIKPEKLERLLRKLFGYKITVRHVGERYEFDAPRYLTDEEIE